MNDPIRWVSKGSDANEAERALLRMGRKSALSERERLAAWSAISATVNLAGPDGSSDPCGGAPPDGSASLGTGSAQAGTSTAALSIVKFFGLGAAVGGMAVASTWVGMSSVPVTTSTSAPQHVALAPATNVAPATATSNPDAAQVVVADAAVTVQIGRMRQTEEQESQVAFPPTPSTPDSRPSLLPSGSPLESPSVAAPAPSSETLDRITQLRAESALVRQVRDVLRAGDSRTAVRLLQYAARRFPNGQLAEERSALLVEALGLAGDQTAAARQASEFLRTYPFSPQAVHVAKHLRDAGR